MSTVPEAGRLAKLVGAAGTVECRGKTYAISPLSLCDYAQLQRFVRGHIIRQAEGLRDLMAAHHAPPEHFAQLEAEEAEHLKDPLNPAFGWVDDDLPLIYRCWLSLRRAQPEVTYDQAAALLADAMFRKAFLQEADELESTEAVLGES